MSTITDEEKKQNNENSEEDRVALHFSQFREYVGPMVQIVTIVAVLWSLFQLYITGFSSLEAVKHRVWYFGFMAVLIFLLFPAVKSKKGKQRKVPTAWDFVCIIATVSSVIYFLFMYDAYLERGGMHILPDYWFGAIGILMTFEASRRAAGLPMTVLAATFLLYNLFGQYIPGSLGHVGFDLKRIIDVMWWGAEGVFGVVAGVAATYISMFILFGAFLRRSGFIKFINNLALTISGKSAGGPAKVAVIGSGMMGMINGSGIANASTVGTFTIPMMKRTGYKSHFAAAVEAVAGTGGVLAPPVMGAASFVMATFLGVEYRIIILAAIIPAILYFTMCFTSVHFEAKKLGLKGLSAEEIPKLKDVMKDGGHLLLPVVVLVYMLVTGVTPIYAALGAIVTTVIASWIRKETRMGLKDIIGALEEGARNVLIISAACMVVGIVVGTISLTSIGLVVGNSILSLAGSSILLAAILTMLLTILLGTGVPVTASYIIAATISVPILAEMGVPPLVSHMFAFFYAALSEITPPIALAALVTSGIAGANFTRVCITAVRLGLIGFIIPYFFLYNPVLLFIEGSVVSSSIAIITGIIGVIALAGAMSNWFLTKPNFVQRVLLGAAGFGLILPSYVVSLLSLIVVTAIFLWQKKSIKKNQLRNPDETSISV